MPMLSFVGGTRHLAAGTSDVLLSMPSGFACLSMHFLWAMKLTAGVVELQTVPAQAGGAAILQSPRTRQQMICTIDALMP
eukprot:3332646-Amphidinium_carterae.1